MVLKLNPLQTALPRVTKSGSFYMSSVARFKFAIKRQKTVLPMFLLLKIHLKLLIIKKINAHLIGCVIKLNSIQNN